MLFWAGVFTFIAFITGLVAFTPFAAAYTSVATILFLVFLFLAVNALGLAFNNRRK